MEISPRVPIRLRSTSVAHLSDHSEALRDLAGVAKVESGERDGPVSTFVVGGATYYVPLDGVVDVDAERERLDKVIGKVEKDAAFLGKKLSNSNFTDRAPEHVVADIHEKHNAAQERLARLREARTGLDT